VAPGGGSAAFQRAVGEEGRPGLPFIYVIPLDGSKPERRLTHRSAPEIDPAWSPDARRIAFARRVRGSFDLYSARLDGSDERRLTHTAHVDELSPAWSPDGARMAFARYESGLERGSGDLWTMDAAGGRERMLLGDEHDYGWPAWSPDGRRLALLKDSLVSVMGARGGIPRPLTRAGDFKDSRPSWSPDGARLAFTRDPGKILTVDSGGSHLRRVPFARSANGVAWVPSR
jgi:TolB protein